MDDHHARPVPRPRLTRVTPRATRAIGPPATLNDIVFAGDGTIYGTTDPSELTVSLNPAVLWRSTDHGSTWKADLPPPERLAHRPLRRSRPRHSAVVYASVTPAGRGSSGQIDRIDVRSGRAVPLPLRSWLGRGRSRDGLQRDAGQGRSAPGSSAAGSRADTCDSVPFPAFQTPPGLNPLLVDPNSAGVLVAFNRVLNSPLGWVAEVSSDSGATWTQGAATTCCNVRFGGPGARSLYSLSAGVLSVSPDAGLSWASTQAVPQGALVVGARPAATFGGAPTDPITFLGEGGRTVSPPISGQLIVDPTDADRLFVVRGDETRLSADGGRSWREIADARFGVASLDRQRITGSGSYLYAVGTRTRSGPRTTGVRPGSARERPRIGTADGRLVVSRDDPPRGLWRHDSHARRRGHLAGHHALRGRPRQLDRTRRSAPHLRDRQLSSRSRSMAGRPGASRRRRTGACSSPAPTRRARPARASAATASGWHRDPLRPCRSPVPYVPGLVAAPDLPGRLRRRPSARHRRFEPRAPARRADAATGAGRRCSRRRARSGRRPRPTPSRPGRRRAGRRSTPGTEATSTSWVRRGAGRWWRLQRGGSRHRWCSPRSTRRMRSSERLAQYGERGVVDLTAAVPRSAAGAAGGRRARLRRPLERRGRRDHGLRLAARRRAHRRRIRRDLLAGCDRTGHALGCRVTARTDFGSSTVTSEAPAGPGGAEPTRPPAVVAPPARGGHALPVRVTP